MLALLVTSLVAIALFAVLALDRREQTRLRREREEAQRELLGAAKALSASVTERSKTPSPTASGTHCFGEI